ncbi:MAG: family 43 glycosylhydrolase [Acetatifactor sp.]|nr:family 43 glycosylhydrolase [Acetatifactor sp.]
MANPYLPGWEYIPDGEPRVFGDRVYIYGSHDKAGSGRFCDTVLKVWSASIHDLDHWQCHGVSFRMKDDAKGCSDIDWDAQELFAPDVVCHRGKYYLFAYLFYAKGCVAVSDHPEGPFTLLGQYEVPEDMPEIAQAGVLVDPGVLVDDDGKVYIYCGFEHSYFAQLDPDRLTRLLPGTFVDQEDFLPQIPAKEECFYEACSPRKVGDTYYMIYSPRVGSRLAYATSDSPVGPWKYRGYIVDNGVDYPAGNNHGSICEINGQWYIFYHRMTNDTIMSRRGCVERITILPDGTIPPVEMTSLGFQDALNPYEATPADIACVLKGKGYITEYTPFDRRIVGITDGTVLGYKYYDFGDDYTSETMDISISLDSCGSSGIIEVLADSDGEDGMLLGTLTYSHLDTCIFGTLKGLSGRHAIYLRFKGDDKILWPDVFAKDRVLASLKAFVFMK